MPEQEVYNLKRRLAPFGSTAFRWCVVVFSAVIVFYFFSRIPVYYEALATTCAIQSCGPIAPLAFPQELFDKSPIMTGDYAFWLVLNDAGLAAAFLVSAVLVYVKSKRDALSCLTVLALITYGCTFQSLLFIDLSENPVTDRLTETIASVGRVSLFLFFLLFPNGKIGLRWTFAAFIPFTFAQILSVAFPGTPLDLQEWEIYERLIYFLSMFVSAVANQIYSYRKLSTREMKQQTKWVVYGITISSAGFFALSLFFGLPDQTPVQHLILNVVLHVFVAIQPLTLSFAVLRHRLWDIDPIVNRTILYVALSGCIILIYTSVVIYLGNLFHTEENLFISLIATAIVASAFGPLKERLQKLLNRYMKGRHDDPYSVLVSLGDRLVQPLAPEEMLRVVADSVRDALRSPYAGISIAVNGQEKMAAESGVVKHDLHSFSIVHAGEELGSLTLSSRSKNEGFTAEDQRLISLMIRQAAPIVRNVTMTLGMKLLALDVQESRQKLILAREEERRQLRRNLHDELAPRLLSLSFNVAAAQQHMARNPVAAQELLDELRQTIRYTVNDIRTMVHDLRPPVLDEFGLIGALKARIEELGKAQEQSAQAWGVGRPLQFQLDVSDEVPSLPAAVEVAAYRIVTEALVNVVKHAKATECLTRIDINTATNELILEVSDNGIGLPGRNRSAENRGIGLTSIRERASELSGSCFFNRSELGGTSIKVILPYLRKEIS